jgi:hypothetical protein
MQRILSSTTRLGHVATRRVGAVGILSTTTTTTPTRRFITSDQEKHFQGAGILDDQGMVIFNTLHELQVNSTMVYRDNELFGTYDKESKSYLFMTYAEYSQKVNQCRALLKDLGK